MSNLEIDHTMQAAYITTTGTPDVIQFGEVPTPEPADGQVLVKVEAVAVNPIDTYIRGGAVAAKLPNPFIVGCDLAGVVEKAGPNATRFAVGDRVWGSNQGLMGRQGTFAEFAAVDEGWLYPTPDGVESSDAAAGALVGITAHLGLFLHAELQENETVFVNGGSGGVGSSVVQLAKSMNATIITTAGTDARAKMCRELGADHVINYNADDIDQQLNRVVEEIGPINVWYETHREQNLDRTFSLMAKRGRVILMAGRTSRPQLPVGPLYVNDLRMFGFAMFNASPDEQRHCAEEINRLATAGRWSPNIDRVLPLSEAAEAHRLQEGGEAAGKIVLTP